MESGLKVVDMTRAEFYQLNSEICNLWVKEDGMG